MDTSGQAAEQIVRYSIEGMEYTLKLAGKGAEHLAAMLMALNRAEQKTRGHTTLRALLKSGKELTVFSIPPDRLKEFAQEAKRYGVLYCALKDKTPSAVTDILVRAEDAAKLSRIVERLGLGAVSQTAQAEVEPIDKEIADSEALLEQILTPPEKEQQNPTMAQTEAPIRPGVALRPTIRLLNPAPLSGQRSRKYASPRRTAWRKCRQSFTLKKRSSRRNDNQWQK